MVRSPQPQGQRRLTVRYLWLIQSSPALIVSKSGNTSTKMGRSSTGVTGRSQAALTMRGVSSRNLCRNEADSETYCSVRRRHSITASDAANALTSGSWTLR